VGGDAVLFTAAGADPRPGDWRGIIAHPQGKMDIRNAAILYAFEGIYGRGFQHAQILEEVEIRQTAQYGMRFEGIRNTLEVTGLEVSQAGSTGVWIGSSGTTMMRHARLHHNGGSGLEQVGGVVDLAYSELIDNGLERDETANLVLGEGVRGRVYNNRLSGGVGIRCVESGDVQIEKNELVDHRIGLISSSARPRITGNEFSRNDLALLVLGAAVPARLELNIVQETARLLENRATAEVTACNNWWGQIDEEQIAAGMSGKVRWRPYLNFDPRRPVEFALAQNFPNPFNGSTLINYSVGISDEVVDGQVDMVLAMYSITGARVRRLVVRPAAPGLYSTAWDGRDEQGERMASGVYVYRLQVGQQVEARKLLLLR